MKRITVAEVHAKKVAELGLDPDSLDLTSTEAIAGAIRRLAGFLCPCTAITLTRRIVRPLLGLVDDLDAIKERVEAIIEAVIAHGDLLEEQEFREGQAAGSATLLYAAPPSFVFRESGAAILLGIASDQLSALPDNLEDRIEYTNHVRKLLSERDEDLRNELTQLGLIELSYQKWLKQPSSEPPTQHISKLDALLKSAPLSGEILGLSILNPESSVRFYPRRWTEPKALSGMFVGRRPQAYGAPIWCYVELQKGNPLKVVDFPLKGSKWRGCDEAWRLQLAIDYIRGNPQLFRVRHGPSNSRVIDFFSPIPMWARRRWDALGEPVDSSGCLFSYKFGEDESEEEIGFLTQYLWLAQTT